MKTDKIKRRSQGNPDLTVGSYRRKLILFAFPLFLSQTFQMLYNTADSFIVGNFLGKEALAAVSSSGPLIFMLTSFFMGLSIGAGIVISRAFGAKNEERLSLAIHTDLMLGVLVGIFLSVAGVVFSPVILRAMGTAPEVIPEAIAYFRIYFLGGIFLVLYNVCTGIMNALGDSRRSLKYLIIASVLNIILDYVFIGLLGLGVTAAATATVISHAVSVFLCIRALMKNETAYRVSLKKCRLHKTTLKSILHFGIPTGVQNSVIGFANVIVQSHVNAFGANATAGYGVFSKVEGMAFLVVTAFSMAISTFVSQNMGANQKKRAKEGAVFGITVSVLLAEAVGIFFMLFSPSLIGLFTEDAEVIRYGVIQARTVSLFFCLLAFSHLVAASLRGAGKAVVPMIIMLSVWCLFRIAYISAAVRISGDIRALYSAYPVTWGISSVIYLLYFLRSEVFKETPKTEENRAFSGCVRKEGGR